MGLFLRNGDDWRHSFSQVINNEKRIISSEKTIKKSQWGLTNNEENMCTTRNPSNQKID